MTCDLSTQNEHTLRLGTYLGLDHFLPLGASFATAIHNPFHCIYLKCDIVRFQFRGITFLGLANGTGTILQPFLRKWRCSSTVKEYHFIGNYLCP